MKQIQMEITTSAHILHLVLDTDRRTIGALSGVMRIGFDFDIVELSKHKDWF